MIAMNCGRGARLRGSGDDVLREKFVGCTFLDNDEGLSVDGPFDLLAERCTFSENAQEGLDAGKLIAPDGEQAGVTLIDCLFARNGAQGADIDLDAPEGGGPTGGSFEIAIDDCAFEANAESGLLVDLDFELHPLWRATVLLRGCEARANGLHGASLDLDAAASVLVHRLSSSGNRGSGFRVTSESRRGMVTLSGSALAGNLGPGAWFSNGNFGAEVAHCVVAGNGGGGLRSDVLESLVHSTVFLEQPDPWPGFTAVGCVESVGTDRPFVHAPLGYAAVQGLAGDELRVSAGTFATGEVAEILDDRVARQITGVSATGLTVAPTVERLATPFSLSVFPAGSADVLEDYRLSPGSAASGAGMGGPVGPAVDAGVFGGGWDGPPGVEEVLPADPFFVVDRSPDWGVAIGANDDFELVLGGGSPDPATLNTALFAIDPADGSSLPIGFEVRGERVVVHPPAGGWPDGTTVQLYPALRSLDGRPLAVPVAFGLEVAGG